MTHLFLFSPGLWIGEGKISFSKSPNTIKFYTKWQITQEPDQPLRAIQVVEIAGVPDQVINDFKITEIRSDSFVITIENEHLGQLTGKGVIEPQVIAWEFREGQRGRELDIEAPEGYEIYQIQENGDYSFRAEYCSSDDYRTLVEGLIWRKV